jgi:protein-S-isoprenylcysteine O-methyltransferase Ste14
VLANESRRQATNRASDALLTGRGSSCRKMPTVSDCVQPGRKRSILAALLSSFLYQITALLCLLHWRSTSPWRDLDFFSGGFFVLNAFLLLHRLRFSRSVFDSREKLREASGLNYDPATIRLGTMLAIADLSVFLDYAHWHLMPALRQPARQIAGLVLYACAVAGLMWTDKYLVRHFQGDLSNRTLMTAGPFGIARHPRYASLLLAKLGFTLLFASVLAWISLVISILMVRHRIRLEETHLREVFGPGYGSYSERTARLLPGIY